MGDGRNRKPEGSRDADSIPNHNEPESCIQGFQETGQNMYHGRLNSQDMNKVHAHFYEIVNERDWRTPVNPMEFDWVYLDADNQVIQARIETPPYGGRSTIHLHPRAFEWDNPILLKGLIHHELVHWVVGPQHAHDDVFENCEKGWKHYIEYKDETVLFSSSLNESDGEYILTCKNCNRTVRRKKRPSSMSACRKCCIEFNNGNWSQDYTFHIGGETPS
jgi:predicted SprT family Zn-dependent metalloprotease